MKKLIILAVAFMLVAIIAFLLFYYGKKEAEMVRQQIENSNS